MRQTVRPVADIVVLKETSAPENAEVLNAVESAASVGMKLAAARKARGLTQAAVHLGTKIKLNHIVAIEAGDAASLPATPFVAGFVKAYAQFLGLDADAFSRAYKAEAAGVAATPTPAAEAVGDLTPVAAPALIVAPAPVAAPAPTPVVVTAAATPSTVAEPAKAARIVIAPEKLTALAGVSAIAILAFWIGGQVASKGGERSAPTVESRIVEPAPAPAREIPDPVVTVQQVAPEPVQEATPIEETVEALAPIVSEAPRLKPPYEKKAEPQPEEITPAPVLFETPQTTVDETSAPIAEAPAPVIQEAKLFKPATPVYPERCAVRAGEQEAVTVRMNVSVDGRPFDASVVETTNACFNTAAIQTAQKMRFLPRTVDGVAQVETGKTATIRFVR